MKRINIKLKCTQMISTEYFTKLSQKKFVPRRKSQSSLSKFSDVSFFVFKKVINLVNLYIFTHSI